MELPKATGAGRPQDHRYNVALYGASGKGKTTWTEEILLAKKRRLIIIDTLCKDYGNAEFCAATGIRYDGVYTTFEEFLAALSKLNGKSGDGAFRLVVRCPGRELDVLKLFAYRGDIKHALITDTTLCIEEIPVLMADGFPDELRDVIVLGRHSRNNLVGIAQVPKGQTHPIYRSQMDIFLSFGQSEDSAIKFFAEFSSDKAEKLKELPPYVFEIFKGDEERLKEFIEAP